MSSSADSWLEGWSAEPEWHGVAGYRSWTTWDGSGYRHLNQSVHDRLYSIGRLGEHWHPGMNVAACGGNAMCLFSRSAAFLPVPCPAWDHRCGLHFVRELPNVPDHGAPLVVGAVQGWGRGIEHPEGWRMQFAQVLALLHPASFQELGWTARYDAKVVERLGAVYDVPLVDRLELASIVARVRAEDRTPPDADPYGGG